MGFSTRLLLSFQLVSVIAFQAIGQISFDSREELDKTANELFEAQEHLKAKPLFSQLLSYDDLDPDYNYRFGVCRMYTEADVSAALPYVEGASNTAGVNTEVFYFLGKLFQLNYRFDEAIQAFEKAKKAGYSAPSVDLDRSMAECRNGMILYNAAIEFKPDQNKEALASEFYRQYDFRKLKGKVIPMPSNFKTKYDQQHLKGTFVYTPTNSNVLIYVSYGEDGANAKDLYRVKRLPNGEWAIPQRLPSTINTEYDEDHAFFDLTSGILYFASKGHNTMGGYDVFSSKYDVDDNSWSTPVNLQYPVNSPYDDFLYVSDPKGRMAFFTSSRNTVQGKLRVFRTLQSKNQPIDLSILEGTYEDATDSIYNYMSATVTDPGTNEVVGRYRSDAITGKYVLILPPKNDYILDVGPRESEGFKFDLDVPKHDVFKTLKQGIGYQTSAEEATVTMTNYFNGTGKKDSISFALNRLLQEVEDHMVAMPDPAELLIAQAEKSAAQRQKAATDSMALAEESASLQKTYQDSIEEVEALALRTKVAEKARTQERERSHEAARQDSIAKVELAMMQEKAAEAEQEKLRKAEWAAQKLAVKQQKARNDSILEMKELAIRKKAEDAARSEEMIRLREVAEQDSISKVELAMMQKKAAELALNGQKGSDTRSRSQADGTIEKGEGEKAELPTRNDEIEVEQTTSRPSEADLFLQTLAKAQEEKQINDARKDSIAGAEVAERKRKEAEQEKTLRDSIAAAEEEQLAILTEMARLEKIVDEVQIAQRQALRDSAEILEMTQAKNTVEEVIETGPEKEPSGKTNEVTVETIEQETHRAEQEMSEADLFLQTIAKLEAQMEQRNNLIDAETKADVQAKEEKEAVAEAERKAAIALAAQDTLALDNAMGENVVSDSAEPSAVEPTVTEKEEIVALKSNVDPNVYLAAINEIEEKIAAEAASRPDKDYTLRYIDGMARTGTTRHDVVDPALRSKIEADREALAAHQKVAIEKEKELKESMQQDQEVLELYDDGLADELKAVEQSALNEAIADQASSETEPVITEGIIAEDVKTTADPEPIKAEKVAIVEKQAAEIIVEEKPADVEVKETAETESTQPKETASERELLEIEAEMAEAEKLLKDKAAAQAEPVVQIQEEIVGAEIEIAETPAAEPLEIVERVSEVEMAGEVGSAMAEEATAQSEQAKTVEVESGIVVIAEQKTEETTSETVAEEVAITEEKIPAENITGQEQELLNGITKAETNEMTGIKAEAAAEAAKTGAAPRPKPQKRVLTVGTIPFLKAALHSYSRKKPSFDHIEDKQIRRLIKRMRGEDIGRLAVMKNMNNQRIDAANDPKALSQISDNLRNREVLTNVPDHATQAELIRQPFNKNDLKQRQNLYYRLTFNIQTTPVSQAVRDAMLPELEVNFAMPGFSMVSGYFVTLADARSGYHQYRGRGFDDVQIIPYLNHRSIGLFEIGKVPFVE